MIYRTRILSPKFAALNFLLCGLGTLLCCPVADAAEPAAPAGSGYAKFRSQIKGIELTDQDGKGVKLYEDLIMNRVSAINFVFTDCPGICPPLGAAFGEVQKLLGKRLGKDVGLITISILPSADTPAKLKAWGARFGAKPGWSLLTDNSGRNGKIDDLLKAMKVYTPDFEEHSPIVLLVDDREGRLKRIHGIASTPRQIKDQILAMSLPVTADKNEPASAPAKPDQAAPGKVNPDKAKPSAAAQRYFRDIEVIDQEGKTRKFYTDLIKGKVVVIGSFFSTCKGACPVMMSSLEQIQGSLGDRFGKEVHFISITVDPLIDTPTALKHFATRFHAKPGWYFLTGKKADIDSTLARLNFHVESKETHSNVMYMGNEPTGLWVKAKGLSSAQSLAQTLQKVLDDKK